MTAVLPVRRPGAASALPPAGDPRLLIGQLADQASHTLVRLAGALGGARTARRALSRS